MPVSDATLLLIPFSSDGSSGFFVGTSHILAPYRATSDGTGYVSISGVPANTSASDTASYYQVVIRGETETKQPYSDSFFIVVPGSSTYDMGSLEQDPPSGTTGIIASGSVVTETAYGQSSTAGVSTAYSRGDHTHGSPAASGAGLQARAPSLTFSTTNAVGAGTAVVGHDATIALFDATVPGAVTPDASAATGSAGVPPRRDHEHGLATYSSTPAAVTAAGATGTSGLAPSRGDHAHPHEAAHVGHDTLWDAAGDYVRGSSADTAVKQAASSATPTAVSTSGSTGTATNPPSADDHVHAHEAAHVAHDTVWDAKGDIVAGTGADTAGKLAIGADDTILMADAAASTGLKWVASAVPVAVTPDAAAATGTSDDFARASHQHGMATYASTPAAITVAGATGSSGDAPSRGTHAHPHEPAHVAHDTIWDAANDYVRGSGADTAARQAASSATPAAVSTSGSTGTAANAPSADDHVHAHEAAHINHDTTWATKGDLIVATANDTAAVLPVGTNGIALVADSTQTTGLNYAAHGAASHTDVTRSIWVPEQSFTADGALGTGLGTAPDIIRVGAMADAGTNGGYMSIVIPEDALAAQALQVIHVWSPGSTDASSHAVRWSVDAYIVVAGANVDTAGTTTAYTGDSAARTVKQPVFETAVTILASVTARDLIRFDVRRLGADAADTYVGTVNYIGALFLYTAAQ